MAKGEQHLSIWFFVGVLLLIYGALILGSGIYGLYRPPGREVVLAHLHAGIWWGALLLVLGGVYTYFFSPGRKQRRERHKQQAGE
jgi:hypothetical protein